MIAQNHKVLYELGTQENKIKLVQATKNLEVALQVLSKNVHKVEGYIEFVQEHQIEDTHILSDQMDALQEIIEYSKVKCSGSSQDTAID